MVLTLLRGLLSGFSCLPSSTKLNQHSKFQFDQHRGTTRRVAKADVASSLNIVIILRAIDSKYGESNDTSKYSDFLLLRQKDPFGELFSEIYFKSSRELPFFFKSRKVQNTTQPTKMNDEIYAKLYICNRPVRKEGNLPRFRIRTVCNLNFYHFSELKVILKQVRFVYFSAI